jgi:hypothetical protein
VREQNGKLLLNRGAAFQAELEHWHFDTFRADWRSPVLGKSFVTFRIGPTGKADEVTIDLAGPITFKRRPVMADTTAGVALSAADLRKYVGNFQSTAPPVVVVVEEVGGRLRVNLAGQPTLTMVPETPTRFKLVGPNIPAGFFLVYTMDGAAVKSITLEQPAPRPPLTLTPAQGG